MENLELICLQIITGAGEARSDCMAALAEARQGEFQKAEEYLKQAADKRREAHKVHTQLITMDAGGELDSISLIMVHSEDIMMGTEITAALAEEMVEMYKKILA